MTYSTENSHTQTVSGNRDFTVTFPFLATTDLKVQLNGVTKQLTNDYTIVQSGGSTVINFNVAPADNDTIRIFRDTDIDAIEATYTAGSAIRASDLNTNNTQLLYAAQEFGTLKTDNSVSFSLGNKGDLQVNSSTDWSLNANSIELAMMTDNSVGTNELINDSVTVDKLANNSVATDFIIADAINGTKIADDSIDSEHIVADSLDTEHYAPGSVDAAAIATNAVTATELADNAVDTNAIVANGVTLAKLAAEVSNALNPVGTVIWYSGSSAPTGYLKANGDSIANGSGTTQSITADFSALYAIVGANLPDLRGEFIRGFDDGKGTDSGRGIRTTQADEFKTHQHLFGGDDQIESQGSYTAVAAMAYDANSSTSGDAHDYRTKSDTSNYGGTETRPRNVALLACIKY